MEYGGIVGVNTKTDRDFCKTSYQRDLVLFYLGCHGIRCYKPIKIICLALQSIILDMCSHFYKQYS